jgi:hypothetical protein
MRSCSDLPSLVKTSAAEMGSDPLSLIGREFPASVGDALPSLVAQPLPNGPVADAEFGRELPRSDGLGHSAIVAKCRITGVRAERNDTLRGSIAGTAWTARSSQLPAAQHGQVKSCDVVYDV